MLINKIIDNELYQFIDEEITSWEEAIRISCVPLINQKIVDESYPEVLIREVKEHGPYIVLLPNLAMPHTSTNAEGVNDTAIAFTKFKHPVSFDENNSSKDAQVFFTLASTDEAKHLENMSGLFQVLSEGDSLDLVMESNSLEDLRNLADTLNNLK